MLTVSVYVMHTEGFTHQATRLISCLAFVVNEYGIIHQTITLREADESHLAFSGGPETRDRYEIVIIRIGISATKYLIFPSIFHSWFPGYSWTITYCQRCLSHLGWKFQLVRQDAATEDRPAVFYGWSASSVTFSSST